jgi:(p)ppGpp synthase/HD superfamily hydrolase
MRFIRPETSYEKQITEIKSYLRTVGRDTNFLALKAFNFGREYHTGMRKGGNAPEYSHQVFGANFARTLENTLLYPQETLASFFLHDVPEDYDVTFETIEEQFGKRVRNAVEALTKVYKGEKIPYPVYFANIAKDPIASIAKGIDRCHNILTMSDAEWTTEKQENYLIDITDWFLPMLKEARERFPEQWGAYENIKGNLLMQAKHIELNISLRNQYENTSLTGLSVG